MVELSSSYDNYTIKNHKFGTQKSVFFSLLCCGFFSASTDANKMFVAREKCEGKIESIRFTREWSESGGNGWTRVTSDLSRTGRAQARKILRKLVASRFSVIDFIKVFSRNRHARRNRLMMKD